MRRRHRRQRRPSRVPLDHGGHGHHHGSAPTRGHPTARAHRYDTARDLAASDGITVGYYDLGPNLVQGVTKARGMYDAANWMAVAQCPAAGAPLGPDGVVVLGVTKIDELAEPQMAEAWDDAYNALVPC